MIQYGLYDISIAPRAGISPQLSVQLTRLPLRTVAISLLILQHTSLRPPQTANGHPTCSSSFARLAPSQPLLSPNPQSNTQRTYQQYRTAARNPQLSSKCQPHHLICTSDPVSYLLRLSSHTHETPIPHGEEARERVEGNVTARALGVVVRGAQLRAGGGEAAAGDGGAEAEGGLGKHLGYGVSLEAR